MLSAYSLPTTNMVPVHLDNSLAVQLMYTQDDNFTGEVLYDNLTEAYLHPDAAYALVKAQRALKELHPSYSLIIYDAARPMSVQKKMWNVVKGTSKYKYVSNPNRGGGLHNYGLAVDISILDSFGQPLPMGALPSEWWHFNYCSRDVAKQKYKLIP